MDINKSKIDWEKVSLSIIINSGSAKSSAMEALYLAKEGKFEEAKVKMAESHKAIAIASHAHFEVIQEEAKGTQLEFKILFMHSEDQLLTTQTLMLLVEELIYIHKVIKK